jgi:CYTH domain-containing protein
MGHVNVQRKWKLPTAPTGLILGRLDSAIIVEAHLGVTAQTETYVRRQDDDCFKVTKRIGAHVVPEMSVQISEASFKEAVRSCTTHVITKTRYDVPARAALVLDVYGGVFAGLVIVEATWSDGSAAAADVARIAHEYSLPKVFVGAVEVTGDTRYDDKTLAAYGVPAE